MNNPFKFLTGNKQQPPVQVPAVAGVPDMNYKNISGQHFYMFDWDGISGKFDELKMDTMAGKTKSLQIVTPFAAMLDRMSKLFALGTDYVTDNENNENFGNETFDRVRQLLKQPNPLQSATMFKRLVETNLLLYGFCPIFGLRANKTDIPTTLWCIPPDKFHAKLTGNFLNQTDYNEIVESAKIQLGYREIKLQPEDYFIVFSGRVNIGTNNEMKVSTPVDTLSQTINNWIAQNIARGSIIRDGGPLGMITNDDRSEFGNAAMTQQEQKKLNDAFKESYGLVGKKFSIMVTQAALKWQPMSWNPAQLMLDSTRKTIMEDICFTLGWSYGLFDPSSQYSNNVAGEEKRTYTTVIIPDSEAYTQSLTKFLNQPNLKYYIDYTSVEALQKDRKQEAETLNTVISGLNAALSNAGITKSEYRVILSEYLDIDPEEVEADDETMLASEIGVGGTQSLVNVITDPNMTDDQKRGVLEVLFNLDQEQVLKMIPNKPEPEPVNNEQLTANNETQPPPTESPASPLSTETSNP